MCSALKRRTSVAISVCAVLTMSFAASGCGNQVHHAAWRGDSETVKAWIRNGGDVNAEHTISGGNILSYAAGSGDLPLVEYLISKGADVRQTSDNGTTPLLYACREGHAEVATLLLSKGADPNAAAENYQRSHSERNQDFPLEGTPLHYVVGNRELSEPTKCEVITVLLEHGADPQKLCRGDRGYILKAPIDLVENLGGTRAFEASENKKGSERRFKSPPDQVGRADASRASE